MVHTFFFCPAFQKAALGGKAGRTYQVPPDAGWRPLAIFARAARPAGVHLRVHGRPRPRRRLTDQHPQWVHAKSGPALVAHTLRVCPIRVALEEMVRRAKGFALATAPTAACGDNAAAALANLPPDLVGGQHCQTAITSLITNFRSSMSADSSATLSGDRAVCMPAPFLAYTSAQ